MTRILIVDDTPAILHVLEELLMDEGYVVQTAPDARTALELFAAGTPDLLITGVMMPGMNGWELLARVRQQWPALPAIVMSAFGPDKPLGSTSLPDHTIYLAKPFDLDEVLSAVTRLLDASTPAPPTEQP